MDGICWKLVLPLITAHILADFGMQGDDEAANKSRPAVLLKHAGIVAVLSYVLVGRLELWKVPFIMLASHALIDLVKTRMQRESLRCLAADQVAHLLVIFLLGSFYTENMLSGSVSWVFIFEPWYYKALILVSGFVLATQGGAIVVKTAMEPYVRQMRDQEEKNSGGEPRTVSGLLHGGSAIGRLERALIFLLIWVGAPGGLGFLVAAKSIFRIGELKEAAQRMQTEYIMIGTLWSFAYGIAVSYGTYKAFLQASF